MGPTSVSSWPLLAERVPQFLLGRFHLARRLLAKENGPEFFSLIMPRDEFFLRVSPAKIHTRWQDAEVAHKIHPQVEHLRPEVGGQLVSDPFLACHVRARDQTLFTCMVPMRLAPHTAHQPSRINCQMPDRVASSFSSF